MKTQTESIADSMDPLGIRDRIEAQLSVVEFNEFADGRDYFVWIEAMHWGNRQFNIAVSSRRGNVGASLSRLGECVAHEYIAEVAEAHDGMMFMPAYPYPFPAWVRAVISSIAIRAVMPRIAGQAA